MTDLSHIGKAIADEAKAELRAEIAKRKAELLEDIAQAKMVLLERDEELDHDLSWNAGEIRPRHDRWPRPCGCVWSLWTDRYIKECQLHQEAQELLREGDV